MRRIKVGDQVQAFLDTRIVGTVLEIEESKNVPWLVEGTSTVEYFCILDLGGTRRIRYKLSELHHVEDF